MNLQDLDTIATVCREVMSELLDEREQKIRADFPQIDYEKVAKEAAALVPVPKDGAPGEQGPPGPAGESVSEDVIRAMVEKEVASIEVEVPAGEPGKDALQLEILPTIDEEKSYPRGTYAKHKGGLWWAFQQTAGMRGWEPIVVGIAQTSVERADDRTFRLNVCHSDGKSETVEYRMPVPIFCGYYKEDTSYHAGDMVSRGGSMWIAKADNPKSAPGMGKQEDWQLVVKKGRDGKNGGN